MNNVYCLIFTFALVILQFSSVNGQRVGSGLCPNVEPLKDFDMNRFMGEWYVIQRLGTSSSCLKVNFTNGDDGKFQMAQTRENALLDVVGVDQYTYTGYLSAHDSSEPSKMKLKLPLKAAYDFIIFDTDYENYAAFISCQELLVGHSKCASIVSRTPTLDQDIVTQVREHLAKQGVDVNDFDAVDQTNCQRNPKGDTSSDGHLKIDDKAFSGKNITDGTKTLASMNDKVHRLRRFAVRDMRQTVAVGVIKSVEKVQKA